MNSLKAALVVSALLFCSAAGATGPTEHSAVELDAFLKKQLAGYAPESRQLKLTLDEQVRVPVSLKRGRCYVMVLRLGDGAAYSATAKQAGLGFHYEPRGNGMSISGGPGVHGPGGAGSGGCPLVDGEFDFVLRTIFEASETDLGTGPIVLQLYSRSASSKELAEIAAMEASDAAAVRKTKAQQAAAAGDAKAACQQCLARYEGCRGAGVSVPGCQEQLERCAFQVAGSSRACGKPGT